MLKIRAPRDFFAGILFIAIGLLGAALARDYPFGTALRMGPGYLPSVLSWCTSGLGAVIALRAFAVEGLPVHRIVWRPLILLLGAIVVFGLTIDRGGLVLATIATAFVGGLAAREMRPAELAALSIGLAAFCAGVFVLGLGQPIALWPH